jgi:hypothetical protein
VWEFDELDQFATYYLHEVYEDWKNLRKFSKKVLTNQKNLV